MSTTTFLCHNCSHSWERENVRGPKPKYCPNCKNVYTNTNSVNDIKLTDSNLLKPVDHFPVTVDSLPQAIYDYLLENKNQKFHVNVKLPTRRKAHTLAGCVSSRARRDNLRLKARTAFSEQDSSWHLWLELTDEPPVRYRQMEENTVLDPSSLISISAVMSPST